LVATVSFIVATLFAGSSSVVFLTFVYVIPGLTLGVMPAVYALISQYAEGSGMKAELATIFGAASSIQTLGSVVFVRRSFLSLIYRSDLLTLLISMWFSWPAWDAS
jgi:hypothetical protein